MNITPVFGVSRGQFNPEMMNPLKLISVLAAVFLAIPATDSLALGDTKITSLVHSVERIGRELKSEFQTHYTRSAAYRHLMKNVNDLLAKADHIDKVSKESSASYRFIKTNVKALDELNLEIHKIIGDVEKGRYTGSVEDGLGHVQAKLRSLNSTIQSLNREIEQFAKSEEGEFSRFMRKLFGNDKGVTPINLVKKPPFNNQRPKTHPETERFRGFVWQTLLTTAMATESYFLNLVTIDSMNPGSGS